MKKKKIVLSYDYELFFGDASGTVVNTLIAPTNKLLDVMDKVGFKGNFFVDWLMLKYLREAKTERTDSELRLIENQIKDIVRRGHRIELHIHPHWVDAKYNGDGTWDFSEFRHYSLNSFTEREINEMFVEGTKLLTDLAREVDPLYKIIAFRAGGWAVQPFSMLKKSFNETGLKIDSSTMPGVQIITDYSSCNFLNISISKKGFYRYSEDVEFPNENGEFLEVPISSVKIPFMSKVVGRIIRSICSPADPLTDGSHSRAKDKPDIWNVPSKRAVCTFSALHPIDGLLRFLNADTDLLCYIDHPKDFSKYTISGIKMISKVADSVLYKDLINFD